MPLRASTYALGKLHTLVDTGQRVDLSSRHTFKIIALTYSQSHLCSDAMFRCFSTKTHGATTSSCPRDEGLGGRKTRGRETVPRSSLALRIAMIGGFLLAEKQR